MMMMMMMSKIQKSVMLSMMLWVMMSLTVIHCNDDNDHFYPIIDNHNIHHHHDDNKIDVIMPPMVVNHAEQHKSKKIISYNNDKIDDVVYRPTDDYVEHDHESLKNDIINRYDNIIDDHNIQHHDDVKIDAITAIGHAKRHPLYNHHHHIKKNPIYDADEYDHTTVDIEQRDSFHNGINMKIHAIMMTGDDRSLQQRSSVNCVYNQDDIQNAITNAPNFSSTSTKIDLCSPNIFINASKPNGFDYQGISIQNKFIEFHCDIVNVTNNCILNAQSLSRIFVVRNSTLVFYDIDFINGNGNKDISKYSNGGVFYLGISSVKMIHCGFSNNIASLGGSMIIFDSAIKILSSNNYTTPSIVQNNIALINGGFIDAYRSVIEIDNYNFYNNTAAYGGAIHVVNTRLKLSGNNDSTLPSVISNNVAIKLGGFLRASDSTIDIHKYMFGNNAAQYGGAIYTFNSIMKVIGSDDLNLPSIITNNDATTGGGFLYADNSTIDIHKYNFGNNKAQYGGAISTYNSKLTLFGSMDSTMPTIYENNVAKESGGAIYGGYSTIIVTQGYFIFRNNLARKFGGGALFFYACNTILENVVFENNFAKWIGGAVVSGVLYNPNKLTSTIVLKNVLFSNNTSSKMNSDSITVQEGKINLDKVSFSRSTYDVSSYDLRVSVYNEDDNDYRKSLINLPSSPPPQKKKPAPQQTCITTDNDLIEEVNKCNEKTTSKSCDIDICGGRLLMNSSNINGINISNKNIILDCHTTCPAKQCIIDGLGISRMLYGSSYNLKVQNVIFMNGFHPDDGGSIRGDNNSVITIINCSFVNSTAPFGSAVIVNSSRLTIEGIESNFVNNSGIGPPIHVLSSQFNISNAIIAGSNISKYDSAILLFNSTIVITDLHFSRSATVQQHRDTSSDDIVFDECDVHVSVYEDDYSNKFSCMDLEKTNRSFPVIDISNGCPTSSPITASPSMPPTMSPFSISAMPSPLSSTTKTSSPISTPSPISTSSPISTPSPVSTRPSPTICFSGENMVEVKDKGYIPMRHVKIGDFVKSGIDLYTQIYGFGHYDHEQEGTYLHFTFDTISIDKNDISQNVVVLSSLEISPKHLVFVDNTMNNNKQQSFIRAASDVVVGDILSGKRIKSIKTVIRRGVYAPLTQSGDIIVNGILASNYVDVILINYQLLLPWNQHTLGHLIFTPQRLLCYYYIDTCKKELYIDGYGVLAYFIVYVNSIIDWISTLLF